MKDTRTRKWQITINNPLEKGFSHDYIKAQLEKFKSCVYWCMSDEVGEQETFHTHIYLACTSQQNRDYVFKEGKWAHTSKEETNIKESHEEWGELPIERQGQRNDMADLYDMIKQGYSDFEIMEESPAFLMNIDKIEKARQIITSEEYLPGTGGYLHLR